VRFLEIAVRYRRKDQDEVRTLDFTVTDRNSCSLLSLGDPFERALGRRLLRHWDILREGRAPSEADSLQSLPALLQLWDMGRETVTGAWLFERRIDPGLLIDIGFLVPIGQDGDEDLELVEDDDGRGLMDVEIVSRSDGKALRTTAGMETPGGPADRYRNYRVRQGWVAHHLADLAGNILGGARPERLDADLVALGTLPIRGRDVPVYLAKGLTKEKTRAEIDSLLRTRKGGGAGLVMQAGNALGSCIGENVLTRLADHLTGSLPDVALNLESLKDAFIRNEFLAGGGAKVEFRKIRAEFGTLFVPTSGSIDIVGPHRVGLIDRLVKAHEDGRSPITSDELRGNIKDQSLANIFGQPLWDKLKAGFIRSPARSFWEIAA